MTAAFHEPGFEPGFMAPRAPRRGPGCVLVVELAGGQAVVEDGDAASGRAGRGVAVRWVSGGHGEELGQFLRRGEVAEGFAGPAVEFAFDLSQIGGAMHAQIGALRHPLP
jgi:hypothetical protein